MEKVNIYKQSSKKLDIKNPLKVSVIIPNYNYQDFITERIDSILLQTYPIYELVILDDCSTDNSREVIEEKIKTIKDIKVKFIKNEKNSGLVFSQWQKGLKNITGDYFWIAEADDSCDNTFLEKVIKPFTENKNLILSYAESKKIDENNQVIGPDCRDWADIFHTHKWDKSYIATGKEEIVTSLSNNNSILNVSSLVWKNNKDYYDIFEQAKNYKVAGDWYIYLQVLKKGDIAYNSESLNYFRKHSKSVSTTVKRNIEYSEVLKIQEDARKTYDLPNDILEKQIERRRMMGFCEDKNNKNEKGLVAWFVPGLLKGSGGHRTIFQNINTLIKEGYKCDVYIEADPATLPTTLKQQVNSFYGECNADMFAGWETTKDYDVVVATAFNTVPPVMKTNCKKKLYFVQDYEPWFFSMGDYYIEAENSYKNDISVISIGKWLSAKMRSEFKLNASYFNFCADLKVYKKLKNVEKEHALCFIFQPSKPRRCDRLALKALQIVKEIDPTLKIYLYGSTKTTIKNLDCEQLGIIPIEECNELYNKCEVGLCMSASNPSRIPFEMMAAGLPVVELHRENNLYDFPNDGCLLAEPTPDAVANAILTILNDKSLAKKMSKAGLEYMKDYPLEAGYDQFLNNFNDFFNGKNFSTEKIEKSYKKESIKGIKETKEVLSKIKNDVTYTPITQPAPRKPSIIRRAYRKAVRTIRKSK